MISPGGLLPCLDGQAGKVIVPRFHPVYEPHPGGEVIGGRIGGNRVNPVESRHIGCKQHDS